MLFSLSRLKSIEFICSQIALHYQSVKTLLRLHALESMLLKTAHYFLSFSLSPSVAISTLALSHSLDLWLDILLHLMQAFMQDYGRALICLSSVIIPGFLHLSHSPFIFPLSYLCESSAKLEIKQWPWLLPTAQPHKAPQVLFPPHPFSHIFPSNSSHQTHPSVLSQSACTRTRGGEHGHGEQPTLPGQVTQHKVARRRPALLREAGSPPPFEEQHRGLVGLQADESKRQLFGV